MYRKAILKILLKSDEKWQSCCANEPNTQICRLPPKPPKNPKIQNLPKIPTKSQKSIKFKKFLHTIFKSKLKWNLSRSSFKSSCRSCPSHKSCRSCPIAHRISHLKSHTGPVHPICHAGPAHLLSYAYYACHIVHLFPEDLADWNALRSCYYRTHLYPCSV